MDLAGRTILHLLARLIDPTDNARKRYRDALDRLVADGKVEPRKDVDGLFYWAKRE